MGKSDVGGGELGQRELFQQDIAIFKHIHRVGGVGWVGWVEANNKAYSGLQLNASQLDRVWQYIKQKQLYCRVGKITPDLPTCCAYRPEYPHIDHVKC